MDRKPFDIEDDEDDHGKPLFPWEIGGDSDDDE